MVDIQIGMLSIQLHRKDIKNLHISVLPPDGAVRVSAPTHMTDTAIRMAVISRIPWIRQQQHDFEQQARQSFRHMVSGEHEVRIRLGRIYLYVSKGTSVDNKMLVLSEYYRQILKERIETLLSVWQPKLEVYPEHWGVRLMKTKWGSCNTASKRIWLNLELAKKPPECLEYIVVHELIHLKERHHNERFLAHMDHHLPDWRERKNLLNSMPLADFHVQGNVEHSNS